MTYEELEEVINNIFASRAKNVSSKTVSVWVKDISSRGFYDKTIKETEQTMMENDEIPPTLAQFLKIAKEIDNGFKNSINTKFKCLYCGGSGIAGVTILFANNGKYLSQNYALKCYHNQSEKFDLTKMELNEETDNRTQGSKGYFLVFKSVMQRDEYLKQVFANKGYDLWVKDSN